MIAFVAAFLSSERIAAVMAWKLANENILVAEGDAVKKYKVIYPILKGNGSFLFNYGAELSEMGLYQQALPVMKRAAIYGNSIALQSRIAYINEVQGDLENAERYYIQAAYMDPKLFVPLDKLLAFYIHTGKKEQARDIAEKIITKKVKFPSVQIDKIRDRAFRFLNTQETPAKIPNTKTLNP